MATHPSLLAPNWIRLPSFVLPTRITAPPFLARSSKHRGLLPVFCVLSSSLPLISASSPSAGHHHHGPSLSKGRLPPPLPSSDDDNNCGGDDVGFLNRDDFTRVFDLAAIRVPAEECAALEGRLRGHLLNWPRIRNVARVAGDEMDPAVQKLISNSGNDGSRLQSLAKQQGDDRKSQPLSPVLYREKLSKQFNCRGYLNFRSLAKISRPKKKKTKKGNKVDESCDAGEKRKGKGVFVTIVVTSDAVTPDVEDFSGLLGEEGFGGGPWRGSTRLLMLDEQYAKKSAEELPQAVKAVIHGDVQDLNKQSKIELVRCQLTLFYDYWPMNEILEALLPEGMVVPSAFETVGHIAHLNLREEHLPYKKLIAQVVLDKNRQRIQTVVNKIDAIQNEFRTMELEVLAGNHSLVTTVIENGTRFSVDLAKVYWNSRLATERQRLVHGFTENDVVCDVFAGVGPLAIQAAKKVRYVYANDLNPVAVDYLERNIVQNKLDRKIQVYNMDGRRFISSIFSTEMRHPITHVVMNLPTHALEFLVSFRGIFHGRSKSTNVSLPKIHVYGFSKLEDPEFDFQERIKLAFREPAIEIEMRRVRLVAPGKWMLCASFLLPRKCAFAKPVTDQS